MINDSRLFDIPWQNSILTIPVENSNLFCVILILQNDEDLFLEFKRCRLIGL